MPIMLAFPNFEPYTENHETEALFEVLLPSNLNQTLQINLSLKSRNPKLPCFLDPIQA